MDRADKKIAVYAHSSGGTGNYGDELYAFLRRNNFGEVVKIDFPFGQRSEKAIRVRVCRNGADILSQGSMVRFSTPAFVSYFKDFFYGVFYGFRFLNKTDIFFGTDNLLAAIGLIFKRIGMVKKVAYVIIDYTPTRYSLKLLDRLYYALDRFCLYRADLALPLNKNMIESRIKDKGLDKSRINYIVSPFGNHCANTDGGKERGANGKIAYFGELSKNKGSELLVPIARALIGKGFEDFKFEIIGGGDIDLLKKEIAINGLEKYFNVLGRIDDVGEIETKLKDCSVALAPYYPEDKNSFSYFADPGKVKFYLGCGLPIVITDVPPIAKELEANGSGVMASYDAHDFSDKIIEILSDEKKYSEYKNNSLRFGKRFDWDAIFNELFGKLI